MLARIPCWIDNDVIPRWIHLAEGLVSQFAVAQRFAALQPDIAGIENLIVERHRSFPQYGSLPPSAAEAKVPGREARRRTSLGRFRCRRSLKMPEVARAIVSAGPRRRMGALPTFELTDFHREVEVGLSRHRTGFDLDDLQRLVEGAAAAPRPPPIVCPTMRRIASWAPPGFATRRKRRRPRRMPRSPSSIAAHTH
jgi:hypothetical protein